MSRYSGPQGKGASKATKATRQHEAQERQANYRAWWTKYCRENGIEETYPFDSVEKIQFDPVRFLETLLDSIRPLDHEWVGSDNDHET